MSIVPPPCHNKLEKLLRDYGSKVRALIFSQRLTQYGIDPDDIEQEVRIRLWRALERDRNSVFHASYIQKVVLSVVIDAIRRAKVRATESLSDDDESASTNGIEQENRARPEHEAQDSQTFSAIKRCLEELPANRRTAVMLHLQGYSLDEISEISGVSSEAARKLISRSLPQLKARLTELGYGTFDEE